MDVDRVCARDDFWIHSAATDPTEYVPVGLFQLKTFMILVAVAFTVIIQIGVPKWNQLPATPMSAQILALVSLLL